MLGKYLFFLFSLPKTIWVNFRFLQFRDAIHLPLFVGADTHIGPMKGTIVFETKLSPFIVKFSWSGTNSRMVERKSFLSVGKKGRLIFKGKSIFGRGCSLIVDYGEMSVGNQFFCNRNCSFSCNDCVSISDDVMFGWNIEVLDSDNHEVIYDNNFEHKSHKPIFVGNHVWVAAYCHLLKGSRIADGSVVGYNSMVTKSFDEECILLGGSPANVLKKGINWIR